MRDQEHGGSTRLVVHINDRKEEQKGLVVHAFTTLNTGKQETCMRLVTTVTYTQGGRRPVCASLPTLHTHGGRRPVCASLPTYRGRQETCLRLVTY